jgi:hypothetical protein
MRLMAQSKRTYLLFSVMSAKLRKKSRNAKVFRDLFLADAFSAGPTETDDDLSSRTGRHLFFSSRYCPHGYGRVQTNFYTNWLLPSWLGLVRPTSTGLTAQQKNEIFKTY